MIHPFLRRLALFNLLRFALWAVPYLLVGCIPAPLGKYYKPSVADIPSQYSGNECHGMAGAPAIMEFPLAPGIQARVDAIRVQGASETSGRVLHIEIELPLGNDIQFTSPTAKIREDDNGVWQALPMEVTLSAAVRTGGRVRMADIAPSLVQAIDPNDFYANATLDYSLPNYVPEQITMTLPGIRIDGGNIIAPARFEAHSKQREPTYKGEYRDNWSLIYTTPESQARLEKRLSNCAAKGSPGTANERCKYLYGFDEGGFVRTLDPFSVSGRWYVFRPGLPFNGELKLEYHHPMDWEFVSDTLSLQDDNGKSNAIPLNSMSLYFHYVIPLDTPLHGVNRPPSKTKLEINGNLGTSEASRYQVQLPALRVNGKLYALPRIDLEKHLFDFGIEPFNC